MLSNQNIIISIQITLIFSVFVVKAKAIEVPPHCYNPNGRSGVCVSVFRCPSLLNVARYLQDETYSFGIQSMCPAYGKDHRPFVCCTSDTDFTTRTDSNKFRIIFPEDPVDDNKPTTRNIITTTTTTTTATTARTPKDSEDLHMPATTSLFPKPPDCGPVTIGNKIYGGEETELGEFPWLANLEYRKFNGDLVSVCAGNIINQRYLLTAAHCIKGEIEIKIGKLVSLRVGDHNTQTPVDCDNTGCLDVFQRMGLEKIIVHADYRSNDDYHNYNDIALIRTDRNMEFSFSVAPVCLPDVAKQTKQLRTGSKLLVAGWGHTGTARFSAEKLKVELPYVENEECPIKVAPEQLCAGGEFRKDSCAGDSGGALVRLAGDAWIVEGIVSFGRGCGLERPGVYTRVSSYISWIHANVEP